MKTALLRSPFFCAWPRGIGCARGTGTPAVLQGAWRARSPPPTGGFPAKGPTPVKNVLISKIGGVRYVLEAMTHEEETTNNP